MTMKPQGKQPKKATKEKLEALKRNLVKNQEIYHDLFRLEDAITQKNVSYNEKKPKWEDVPHRHYYHTVSSDGKDLDKSAPSAGHFHEVTLERNEEGEILSAKCGPPKVMHKGKPYPYKNDDHTHDVVYIESEMVQKRKMNEDALQLMSIKTSHEQEVQKGVAGVIK
jgi:hypothetical protein